MNDRGGIDRDVTARIGKARAVFVMLKNIWPSKEIRTRTKFGIFNFNVKPRLLYGVKLGGRQRQCYRKSRHSSTPVSSASTTSDGQR